eukprot:755142-Hanusia_phi.AAC.2
MDYYVSGSYSKPAAPQQSTGGCHPLFKDHKPASEILDEDCVRTRGMEELKGVGVINSSQTP